MIKDISAIQPGEAENDTDRLLDPPSMPWPEGSIEATMAPEARAQLLTERIRENGSTAARAVWAIGRDLRTMKAEKLFQELGYDTFEDYAEQEFQLKRRQAYTYISVYEKIGQNEPVQSTAQLGITKLSLLTTVDAEDRAEILAEHDVAGMTTKELEKLLEDYKIQGEQLSLMEEKVEELESVRMDTNALIDRAEKLEAERDEWIAEAKAAKEAQTEIQELKDKLAAEAEKHREELEKVKAEAQKPADSGDKQSFKHAYAASYKELTGLLEIISSTDDKQERQIFQAKAEQLLALVGEKLRELEGAADE